MAPPNPGERYRRGSGPSFRSQVIPVGDHAIRWRERWKLIFQFAEGHRLRNEHVGTADGEKLVSAVHEIVWFHVIVLLLPVRVSRRGSGISAFAVYVGEASIAAVKGSRVRTKRKLASVPAHLFAPFPEPPACFRLLRKLAAMPQESTVPPAPLTLWKPTSRATGFPVEFPVYPEYICAMAFFLLVGAMRLTPAVTGPATSKWVALQGDPFSFPAFGCGLEMSTARCR